MLPGSASAMMQRTVSADSNGGDESRLRQRRQHESLHVSIVSVPPISLRGGVRHLKTFWVQQEQQQGQEQQQDRASAAVTTNLSGASTKAEAKPDSRLGSSGGGGGGGGNRCRSAAATTSAEQRLELAIALPEPSDACLSLLHQRSDKAFAPYCTPPSSTSCYLQPSDLFHGSLVTGHHSCHYGGVSSFAGLSYRARIHRSGLRNEQHAAAGAAAAASVEEENDDEEEDEGLEHHRTPSYGWSSSSNVPTAALRPAGNRFLSRAGERAAGAASTAAGAEGGRRRCAAPAACAMHTTLRDGECACGTSSSMEGAYRCNIGAIRDARETTPRCLVGQALLAAVVHSLPTLPSWLLSGASHGYPQELITQAETSGLWATLQRRTAHYVDSFMQSSDEALDALAVTIHGGTPVSRQV